VTTARTGELLADVKTWDHASKVRDARTRLGVTQIELARLLNVSNVTVNRWERGKSVPSSAKLDQIALLTRHGSLETNAASEAMSRLAALPRPLTSFVGREGHVAAVAEALRAHQVVTLTGPGGSGKTRLAIETAGVIADRFTGGTIFVDLAPLSDPRMLEETVARIVCPVDAPRLNAAERIRSAIGSRTWLLLIDNCEHVLDSLTPLVGWLSREPYPPRILATSRVSLGVSNELVWPVPPLALDGDGSASPAVRLFLSRAKSADPAFAPGSGDTEIVHEICRRLDGLPLGIELAAARVSLLTPTQIRDRLESGLPLLRDNSRPTQRHQTLYNAIAWGFDLLDRDEQQLFERLGVFAGSFDLDAVDAICCDPLAPGSAIDGIAGLVKHSMLVVDQDRGGAHRRYRMLETLRAFALKRLRDRGEAEEMRDRHAIYFLELVERTLTELNGPEQSRWLDLIEADEDNLRTAMTFACTLPESDRMLRFATGLWRFWSVRGRIGEGRIWTERALEHPDPGPLRLRAEALKVAGNLANDQGDHVAAPRWYREGLVAFRQLGDRSGEVRSLSNLSIVSSMQGDYAGAKAKLDEALGLARELGDTRLMGNVLHNLAVVQEHLGEFRLAAERYAESQTIFEGIGDQAGIATVLNNLGNLARGEGKPNRAVQFYREALARRESIGDALGIASCLHNLGTAARILGDDPTAKNYLERSLAKSRELGNQHGIANSLAMLGLIAADAGNRERASELLVESLLIRERLRERSGMAECFEGLAALIIELEPVRAARLFGAAARERKNLGEEPEPFARQWLDDQIQALKLQMGSLRLADELETGGRLTVVDAIESALSVSRPGSTSSIPRPRSGFGRLSSRQREVIDLVARGETNAGIARLLGISKRTVESHISAIYSELGVSSRAAAIAYAQTVSGLNRSSAT
jgi:predicted ATPase/DNA-binding CsgD family transcriptional regulator/DNA-binding transcriptional regulator YiaG/Tfp pilus assembly protein PilF